MNFSLTGGFFIALYTVRLFGDRFAFVISDREG